MSKRRFISTVLALGAALAWEPVAILQRYT